MPKHTPAERQRVLAAIDRGDDWLAIAKANGISRSSAYELKRSRCLEDKKRGGVRAKCVKMTPEIVKSLEEMLKCNPSITLEAMALKVFEEYGVKMHISTISRHLLGLTNTIKKTRTEVDVMNHIVNKRERRALAMRLQALRAGGRRQESREAQAPSTASSD